jgi:hypothetical protein
MVTQRQLSEVALLLLTTPDDTEEAPWMVMPDFQWRVIALLVSLLRLHALRAGQRWYLAPELKVTLPRPGGGRPLDLAPDLLMAVADDVERDSWDVRKEGQPPLFVLEVVTKESAVRDQEEKPLLYDALGVREYVLFAPRARPGAPQLLGYRRDEAGRFVPWPVDAAGALWSTALDLGLYVEGGKWLRARDAEGRRLPSAEEEAARAQHEAARAQHEAARADRAEAELARLRALLRQQEDA